MYVLSLWDLPPTLLTILEFLVTIGNQLILMRQAIQSGIKDSLSSHGLSDIPSFICIFIMFSMLTYKYVST